MCRTVGANALADACRVLRDAAWAVGLHPSTSHSYLGVSTADNYTERRERRSAWVGFDYTGRLQLVLQEAGTTDEDHHDLPDLGETTLRRIAEWALGDHAWATAKD